MGYWEYWCGILGMEYCEYWNGIMGVKPTNAGNISESFVVRKHAGGERVNDDLGLTVLHFPD